jgi:alkylation response protein AidB-like acyl-CoA dehydrogenase
MTQDNAAKRVKAHRVLSLTMILVALLGWGAFAYASHSADVARRGLQEAVALHKADRAQLLDTHAAALQEAQGRIADLEQQLQLATMTLNDASSEVTQTGTLPSPAAVSTIQKSNQSKPRR